MTAPDLYALTPVEYRKGLFFKRDDLFTVAGANGGKARTVWALAQNARGLVTAGNRHSRQASIVAHIAQALGIPCSIHTPTGALDPIVEETKALGATVTQHHQGFRTVLAARAKEEADRKGYVYIPYGMDCQQMVDLVGNQTLNMPDEVERIVVCIGSGMTFCGILRGLRRFIPVLGVSVVKYPHRVLKAYGVPGRPSISSIVESPHRKPLYNVELFGVQLDEFYEAHCASYVQEGDCFWIAGYK